jgi:hypothetical protein
VGCGTGVSEPSGVIVGEIRRRGVIELGGKRVQRAGSGIGARAHLRRARHDCAVSRVQGRDATDVEGICGLWAFTGSRTEGSRMLDCVLDCYGLGFVDGL